MQICGIIAEYDPFHNGHAWHIKEAKRVTGADKIICIITGCFTQRGTPAFLHPSARAEMALREGADLVLQLPFSFSVCDADRFARAGISILSKAGASSICFGAEQDGIPYIHRAAAFLSRPDNEYSRQLHHFLKMGCSYPRAQSLALAASTDIPSEIIALPNTILGIAYARACHDLNAVLTLYPVARRGNYHDPDLHSGGFPSAAAIRKAISDQNLESVRPFMPAACFLLLKKAYDENRIHYPNALDSLLRWKLYSSSDFHYLPGLSEGLENRLHLARSCTTRDSMVQTIRSKRYTYSRINRLLTHVLTETDSRLLSPLPDYAYLLGFRKDSSFLLHELKNSGLNVLPRLVPGRQTYEQHLDETAESLWALAVKKDFGCLYRQKPLVLTSEAG